MIDNGYINLERFKLVKRIMALEEEYDRRMMDGMGFHAELIRTRIYRTAEKLADLMAQAHGIKDEEEENGFWEGWE